MQIDYDELERLLKAAPVIHKEDPKAEAIRKAEAAANTLLNTPIFRFLRKVGESDGFGYRLLRAIGDCDMKTNGYNQFGKRVHNGARNGAWGAWIILSRR